MKRGCSDEYRAPFALQVQWRAYLLCCRRHQMLPRRHALIVSVATQKMGLWSRPEISRPSRSGHRFCGHWTISTSRFGIGQLRDSNRTPLGLHQVAERAGLGWPVGTVFEGRRPVGFTWQGKPDAPIAHRILWLDGLEPGRNRGGDVDSKSRYIYLHGVGDELTLGRPASRGCIHAAAHVLLPLADHLPAGSHVWIGL